MLDKTIYLIFLLAQVAQSVEQRTENPRVGGSIPPLGTIILVSHVTSLSQVSFRFQKWSENGLRKKKKVQI